jgi:hypothetical protein
VDECDAPVSRHIDDIGPAEANAKVLRGFCGALKNSVNRIRFAIVTGITRFAMTSVDSEGNNFKALTLNREFSGFCGFTIK